MSRRLPPLDMHAHLRPDIDARELEALGAVVFAVTRDHSESVIALDRSDRAAVWGIGAHPGLVGAQRNFDSALFERLLARSPFVGEVGLDARSRVQKSLQWQTFRAVLRATASTPRIVSIHSSGATDAVLRVLAEFPNRGAILHWWLGDERETARAVELGCYFSVNAAGAAKPWLLRQIPLDRLLPETDHPAGDRVLGSEARPGNVGLVEGAISRSHGVQMSDVRQALWKNLGHVVSSTGTRAQLPELVRRVLDQVESTSTDKLQ